jgi:hypothetical protein
MARSDVGLPLQRVDKLVVEINKFVPTTVGATELRADLAGLLVVAIAASYEACVKETLINHASKHHAAFGRFAGNNYEKLNSRINMRDLYQYTDLFDPRINARFKLLLTKRAKKIDERIGKNIIKSYETILNWRHDFAHAWKRNTTIEEAIVTHNLAKRVIFSFNDAFD